jgi:pimeloyl-ACP methyl ester carboxylesterase
MKCSDFRAAAFLPIVLLVLFAATGCRGELPTTEERDTVVLLHGLGRSDMSMRRMERRLVESGYTVLNVGYSSTEHSIEHISETELRPALLECCSHPELRVHFVTHSMGGIVVRYYLAHHEMNNLGRVVMLSPPNQGSELADWVAENEFLGRLLGPSAEQLGTDSTSVPNQLGAVDFEVGIITGNRTLNPLYSGIIPGEDDGKVSVERAKVEGMADFLIVPHTHTYIMLAEDVAYQTVYFLQNGEFDRSEEGDADREGAASADSVPGEEE